MVEFSKDSTNIKPKIEKANISVKEDKTLSLTSSSSDLALVMDYHTTKTWRTKRGNAAFLCIWKNAQRKD